MPQVLMIKATLRTRCGCWKHVDISYPPPRELLVPLKMRPISLREEQDPAKLKQPLMEVRHFELQDYRGGKDGWADYERAW